MPPAQAYMVKQWIGKVRGDRCDFIAFTTGDARYLLFAQLDEYGCQTGLMIPILRRELRRDWRRRIMP